jgi:hypothetical protein
VHEASLYENNSFITLTYSDAFRPWDNSLDKSDFQKFMKRLRKSLPYPVRFYHCGEYGDTYGRPHFHACIFNHDFMDKKPWQIQNKEILYRSKTLEGLWEYGYSSIGSVTFQSAAYVARYIMKKINGDHADQHYEWIDPETGEIHQRAPEYTTMSRRPGIGKPWLDKFGMDIYPDDFVIINNKKMRPPRFYDTNYEIKEPDEFQKIKRARKRSLKKHQSNNTPERLRVREKVQLLKLQQLPRKVD